MSWIAKNIRWLYFYIFTNGLYFDRALWVLYLGERGMNMAQVGVLESLLHLVIVFMEVPTGLVADLYGRKRSLLIGSCISVLYAVFMMIGGHFFVFSLAFGLMGLGITFKSGAEQALLYDTLKAGRQEARYTRILGNQNALILISLSLANWVGGMLSEISWNLVYTSTLICVGLGLIPVLFLKEPARGDLQEAPASDEPKRRMRDQFRDSWAVWKEKRDIRMPILLVMMVSTMIVVVSFYSQEYFELQGFTHTQIGLIFMAEYLLGAGAVKFAYLLERRYSFPTIFFASYYSFLLMLVIYAVIQGWVSVALLFLLSTVSVLLEPIFSNFIQQKLTSDIRATFFSMISLGDSVGIMVVFPLFGSVVDRIGFTRSFLLLVVLLLLVGLYATLSHLKARTRGKTA
ncbi:MAG TPA: MFS transporter [Bacilli bacterium]|nr:MFS transporter [Bacilli bacterium]